MNTVMDVITIVIITTTMNMTQVSEIVGMRVQKLRADNNGAHVRLINALLPPPPPNSN